MNEFMVSTNIRGGVVIMRPPMAPLSTDQALALAAWLVAVSCASREDFEAVLSAVEAP